MSTIADAQQELIDAFDTELIDFVNPFFLEQNIKGGYDSVTAEHQLISTSFNSRGVFEHFKTNEILKDSEIKASDTKLTVIASELSTIPAVDDIVNKEDRRYTTIKIKELSGIAYELQLRGI